MKDPESHKGEALSLFKRFAAVLATAAAVSTAGALIATPAGASSQQPKVLGACAELTTQGPGWATLRNDCGVAIEGSVSLSSGDSPACVPIAARGTNTVTWKGEGRAEYAFDCV
ncbi:hypothetical protein ABZ897_26520 [Nonomuraea sp. NPDC046802]|uniref:hypothetical protein n=1 Tax=Nonomuraea sp. NPDC046802 TaxID=3154919 RepID=UPI003404B3C0